MRGVAAIGASDNIATGAGGTARASVAGGTTVGQPGAEGEVLDAQSLPKVKMPIGNEYASLPEWKPRTRRLQVGMGVFGALPIRRLSVFF